MSRGPNPMSVGQRFGRLTVLGPSEDRRGKHLQANCVCDCGAKVAVPLRRLRGGNTRSCGCLRRDESSARATRQFTKHGEADSKKGAPTPEYRAWRSMLQRCAARSGEHWRLYGSRGIAVCAEWRESYEAFLSHIGRRPSPNHSVDRIESNGNYEPGNVRWATPSEQVSNRRCNVMVTVGAERVPLTVAARRAGLDRSTVRDRIRRGWTPEEAVSVAANEGRS